MTPTPTTFGGLIELFLGILGDLFPVLIGLSLVAFLWGLVKFIFRVGGDEKAVADGKKLMIWGLIALFALVSFLGIISFFQDDLGVGGGGCGGGLPLLPTGDC